MIHQAPSSSNFSGLVLAFLYSLDLRLLDRSVPPKPDKDPELEPSFPRFGAGLPSISLSSMPATLSLSAHRPHLARISRQHCSLAQMRFDPSKAVQGDY